MKISCTPSSLGIIIHVKIGIRELPQTCKNIIQYIYLMTSKNHDNYPYLNMPSRYLERLDTEIFRGTMHKMWRLTQLKHNDEIVIR